MGKAHVFPYDIVAYKQNKYVVDPLWRGVTVSGVGVNCEWDRQQHKSISEMQSRLEASCS